MITLNRSTESKTAELAKKQKEAIAEINSTMSEVRKAYVTDIVGQDMLYQAKEEEAKAYLLNLPVDLVDYPLISGEIGITGTTAYEVAQVYVNMAAQWKQLAGTLENLRLGAVKEVEEATTISAITSAKTNYMTAIMAI